MPNPGHSPREWYWPLSDDMRIRVWLTDRPFDRKNARLQKLVEGVWRNAGPYVTGGSDPELLGRLVRSYRDVADMIESRYKHPDVKAIDDGCRFCGYSHPRMLIIDGRLSIHCPACSNGHRSDINID
ncbi:hypothetical protein [Salinisphaera sp. LB1]|uniref:hypothetical protein n=1 Tax=Salinisphaera sp. LB1 TaxID=2183911 RepID=UPI000FF75B66|nr:hypothetical protein [Salinisphaera sp. LB1]